MRRLRELFSLCHLERLRRRKSLRARSSRLLDRLKSQTKEVSTIRGGGVSLAMPESTLRMRPMLEAPPRSTIGTLFHNLPSKRGHLS